MNTILLCLSAIRSGLVIAGNALTIIGCALAFSISHAQTAPPPNLGEETKGTPAIEESTSNTDVTEQAANTETADAGPDEAGETRSTSIFGKSTVVESRRENGQVYSIELQHSNAPTQYIEETNSDGNIEFESKDVEDTPNLPKWKLGSW